MKGNVLDMGVGIVTGVAFRAVIKGLVHDILMPSIGLALGGSISPPVSCNERRQDCRSLCRHGRCKGGGPVIINYGVFVNTIISFVIVAFTRFMIVRIVTDMRRQQAETPAPVEPTTKHCPYCVSTISIMQRSVRIVPPGWT